MYGTGVREGGEGGRGGEAAGKKEEKESEINGVRAFNLARLCEAACGD